MGYAGLVLALVTLGYILGVWTAFLVLKQPQSSYEDPVYATPSSAPVRDAQRVLGGRR
ncbi:MAG TPA: hypothetical protein VIJ91_00140 [Candidatus Dormibacteraeota bacterium]